MTTEFYNIGAGSYNTYDKFPLFSYTCISHLLSVNELIWKLLYYNDPDAWNKGNLSAAQKGAMIYNGAEDMEEYHVFMDGGQSDAWTRESTVLRIYPWEIYPNNRTIGTVCIAFEVFSHYKLNHLSNYSTRIDTIVQQIIKEFNGFMLGDLGRLEFDNKMGSITQRMTQSGQSPYKGKYLLMSTKSGAV
jgi:hypothetical protein